MKGQASKGVWEPTRDNSGGDACSGGSYAGYPRGHTYQQNRVGRKFQLAAEPLAAAAASGDILSDSESEDEDDDTPLPTRADARVVFNPIIPFSEEGDPSGGKITAADDNSPNVSKVPDEKGICDVFPRDRATGVLEAVRRAARVKAAEKLANRMDKIGAEVREGPGLSW